MRPYTYIWDSDGERACVVSPSGSYYAAVEARCLYGKDGDSGAAELEALSRAEAICAALNAKEPR